jgi:hypothetical protein
MRKVLVVAGFAVAGLLPLLRYHPDAPSAAAGPVATLAPPAPTTPGAPPAPGRQVVNGSTVDSDYGPYQVQVTFSGNRITDVRIITEPGDRHSRRIAADAEPTLREEALQAQSAHLDTVSGATATSEAYARSLQAAIDAKGN